MPELEGLLWIPRGAPPHVTYEGQSPYAAGDHGCGVTLGDTFFAEDDTFSAVTVAHNHGAPVAIGVEHESRARGP